MKLKDYLIKEKNKLFFWLNEREHHKYNWKGRFNYLITIASIFFISIIVYNIIYTNAVKLESINLWIINILGVLLLASVFFIIKYGWRILKEIPNIVKRQRNWLRWLIIVLLLFVVWQAYENRDNVFNPLLEFKEKTNFSYFNPLDINDVFNTDPEQYRTNPKTVNLGSFNYVVYGGVNDYLAGLDKSISYSYTPPSSRDFIMRDLDNEIQKYYLLPFVQKIQEKSTDKKEQARIAISIVQGIPYDWEAFTTDSVTGRYPYEVLYDMKGVCMEKADLLAFTLRELGFGVAIFEFEAESHRAVGIKCSKGNYNTDYCFIEATDYYPVGQIPDSYVGGVDIRKATPEVILISEGDSFS